MEIVLQEVLFVLGVDGDIEEVLVEVGFFSFVLFFVDGCFKVVVKCVIFLFDEDIVFGVVEFKDFWRYVQNVIVDEVIGVYKQVCQKLNCRQIFKFFRQLQEFIDFGYCFDCLDLKGEKFDYKICEVLEEVFKRLQFKVVDLEQINLDEDGVLVFFDMIEYYELVIYFNIFF